jgi:GNAT superfamily N-acetyltransferase
MTLADLDDVVALQRDCFPEPFPEELLWQKEHLERHLEIFPEGQFVVREEGKVVASASNAILSEEHYQKHLPWEEAVGGFWMSAHDPNGTTLYGLDISVAPACRGRGLGASLYLARFALVRRLKLKRYATSCRMPGFAEWVAHNPGKDRDYVSEVRNGRIVDRTLTPLLRYGLVPLGIAYDHMDDPESLNCACLLEWEP